MSVHEPLERDVEDEDRAQSRRPVVAGVAAGLWAFLVGVALVTCLVMAVWAVSPNSSGDAAAAWRAAGTVWLGAHQVPLSIGDRELTLLPLGAVLLGLLLTRHGGRWAGRLLPGATPGEALGIVVSCALVYATGAAGVAWLATGPGTGASPPVAFLWAGAVALVGATWGVARSAALVDRTRARVSDGAWRTVMGAVAAVVGLFGVGAALVTASLMRHFGEIAAALDGLEAGSAGALGLTLLGVLCLPTLDIWAMSLAVGPGVDLGSSGSLSAFGGQVETLPALPVLAAIPAIPPQWAPALLLAPVALGVLAGRIRWGRDLPTLSGSAVSGAGLAGVVAVLVGGLVLLASGSVGGGRLAQVGPPALPVVAAAAGLVLLGFLADAGLQSLRLTWDLHQAERRAEESRLRRAARGLAEPVAEPDGATPDADRPQEPAFDVAGTGHDDPAAVSPPGQAPVRTPRRVRDALVIPIVVAGVAPVAEPLDPGTPAPVAGSGSSVLHEGAVQDDLPPGTEDGEQAAGDVSLESGGPEQDVTVDLTAQWEGDEVDVHLPVAGPARAEGWGRQLDGDSTVDLTVDPADLAEIRAARADSAGGEDPA
ncbi:MAG: DUF6350 family protein [Candidatus Nanopelagicales bacterium]|nr:DUF6350 family protein [Candidatus Nanopelagicales bacterium]